MMHNSVPDSTLQDGQIYRNPSEWQGRNRKIYHGANFTQGNGKMDASRCNN
jgi:hypothetical protein